MNLSRRSSRRPVATTLLTIGIALAGIFAFTKLPVAPLPQVDFPTISVQATLPGASPETVATSVASPLERHLGADRRRHRDDVAELGRLDADHPAVRPRPRHRRRRARRAGGDQRGARGSADEPAQQPDLPQGQPGRRADPDPGAHVDDAHARPALRLRGHRAAADAVAGGGHRRGGRERLGATRRACRTRTAARCSSTASASRTCAPRSLRPTRTARRARSRSATDRLQIYTNDQASKAVAIPRPGRRLSQRRGGAAVRRRPRWSIPSRICATSASSTASARCWSSCTASPARTSSTPSTA